MKDEVFKRLVLSALYLIILRLIGKTTVKDWSGLEKEWLDAAIINETWKEK